MDVLKEIQKDFTTHEYSLVVLYEKFSGFCKQEMPHSERLAALIKAAVELTTQEAPDWEFIAPVYSISNYRRNWKSRRHRQASVRFTTNCVI